MLVETVSADTFCKVLEYSLKEREKKPKVTDFNKSMLETQLEMMPSLQPNAL